MSPIQFALTIVVVFVLGWLLLGRQRRSGGIPIPGPPRLPIVGNLHQAPKAWPWRTFRDWSKVYGPIFSLQYGKDTIIVLNSHRTAKDLLDKRSSIYSSRPHLVMAADCHSKGNRSLLLPYGPQYRSQQRVQGGLLHPRYAQTYITVQDLESKQLMFDLLSATEDEWMDHLHRYSSSLVFSLAYGKRMPRGDEKELKDVEQVVSSIQDTARPGWWIVDAIPALNKLPKFLAPWKRVADEYHEFESTFFMRIREEAEHSQNWNWVKAARAMKETSKMPTKELSYVVGTLYEAGSDTTTTALQTFIMAVLTYPEVVHEAHKELDAVVKDQFPTFADRTRLPYIEAIVKEVLRWRPVAPQAVPHAIDQRDDEYMGYRIPKGSTIIANHWAIDLDENVYGEDALEFRPSRWLENPELPLASFGYGRRVCTGQHVAMRSLFINIARMLWAFNIEHATDANGERIEVDPMAYTQGFLSAPLPFKARFIARSEAQQAEVERQWASVEKDIRVHLDEIERATSGRD